MAHRRCRAFHGSGDAPADGLLHVTPGPVACPGWAWVSFFSGSAQLGLLMVINSGQMLASGSTPIGPFSRSWLVAG